MFQRCEKGHEKQNKNKPNQSMQHTSIRQVTTSYMALFHCMVRYGSVRYGTAQFGSVAFPPQFSTAIEWAGLFTRRYNCAASTAWHHSKRATNKLTTKKGDGTVFFILGMWMCLTAMERSMRMLGIYPSSRDCGGSDTGCRWGGQGCLCRCAALLD